MDKGTWATYMARVRTRARHQIALFVFAVWMLVGVLSIFIPQIDYAPGDIRGTTLWRAATFVIIFGVGLVGLTWSVRGLWADQKARGMVVSTTIQSEPGRSYQARRELTIRQLAARKGIGGVAAETLVGAWEAEAAARALDRDSLTFWEEGVSWIVEHYLR